MVSVASGGLALPRKREYGSPPKWYLEILLTRNSGSLVNADIVCDEKEYSAQAARGDPFLYATSATDPRRFACAASRMGRTKWRLSHLRIVRITPCRTAWPFLAGRTSLGCVIHCRLDHRRNAAHREGLSLKITTRDLCRLIRMRQSECDGEVSFYPERGSKNHLSSDITKSHTRAVAAV